MNLTVNVNVKVQSKIKQNKAKKKILKGDSEGGDNTVGWMSGYVVST